MKKTTGHLYRSLLFPSKFHSHRSPSMLAQSLSAGFTVFQVTLGSSVKPSFLLLVHLKDFYVNRYGGSCMCLFHSAQKPKLWESKLYHLLVPTKSDGWYSLLPSVDQTAFSNQIFVVCLPVHFYLDLYGH